MNTPTFDRATQCLGEILAIYNRSVSRIQTPDFVGEDKQGTYLDASNRYFSSTRDGKGGAAQDFTPDVDPTGALAQLNGDRYYHGEENRVEYFRRCYKLTEERRW